jgi:L-ascorbate metabolism protein UlaG (beta-lactamase superfamily)
MLTGLEWFGHASVRFGGDKCAIFVDPYRIRSAKPVDMVLVTHAHFDHLSPDDIRNVSAPGTVIVAPEDCAEQLGPACRAIKAGERLELGTGVFVEAYPAYNIDKQFHPRQKGWVGYVIEMDGRRVYVAGDTDRIPEMLDIRCDVAFLPVGGTYTMTAEEAVAAARDVEAGIAVPIHWGTIVGSRADAERFVSLYGRRGRLLEIPGG